MKKEMFDTLDGRILRSFQILKKIGQGAYGQVWKVKDKKTSSLCALKKIYDAFRNPTDAQRAYRQIKYLQRLNHPNIIKIISYIQPESSKDIYLALQFMQADLSTAIRNQVLKQIHKHYIFFQIANAIHYLHSVQLIHRDLKPSNILVNENCQVKICDFGLIRSVVPEDEERLVLTENIATRWYRAPQILLCSNSYGKQIDVWSLGCVLAQIYYGRAIFQGSSAISQLQKIFELTGKPIQSQLSFIKSQASKAIVQSMAVTKKKHFETLFPHEDRQMIDLLQKMLKVDPRKRITIEQIMLHPFVSKFKGKMQEHVQQGYIKINHQSTKLSVQQYKHLLQHDIDSKCTTLNTAKTSELSTFYQSSITQSLPNHSQPQHFINNCSLGRPDRFSPQRNTPSPLVSVSPQHKKQPLFINHTKSALQLRERVKISNDIDSHIKGNEEYLRPHFPLGNKIKKMFSCQQVCDNKLKKQNQLTKQKSFQMFSPPKSFSPTPNKHMYLHKKTQNQQSPFKLRVLSRQGSKSPLKIQNNMLKVMQEMMDVVQNSLQNRRSRKASPSPQLNYLNKNSQQKPLNSHFSSNFQSNRTIGLKQQNHQQKLVPKFILQGKNRLNSGSPIHLDHNNYPNKTLHNKHIQLGLHQHLMKHQTSNQSQQSLQFKRNNLIISQPHQNIRVLHQPKFIIDDN